jgi:hypothetical protein
MAYVVRQRSAIVWERGESTTLSLDVRNSAGEQQTLTSVTLGIWDASSEVLATGTAATADGPPSTYTVAAALTTDRALSGQLLAIWEATVNGQVEHFRQVIHLVRHRYHATITDTDLTNVYSELTDLLPSDLTSYEKYRVRARERIERDMLKVKKRPELIFDAFMLHDAHVALSLAYIFQDWDSHLDGPSKWGTKAKEQFKTYSDEFRDFKGHYDANQSGTVDDDDNESAGGILILTSGPIR